MGNSGRKPWVAGLLTGFAPGLGQVYCGQWQKGLKFYLVYLGGAMVLGLVHLWVPLPPFNLIVPLALIFGFWVYILIDAVRTAKNLRQGYQLKPVNKWYT